MVRTVRTIVVCFSGVLLLFRCCVGYADTPAGEGYRVLFGWKTAGSIDLLGKKATALKKFRDNRTISISFGSLMGDERIVEFDEGAQFLSAAKKAGIDYVIPGAAEFMFGAEVFSSLASSDLTPQFVTANITEEKTGKPLVSPYLVFDFPGVRICLIALSDMRTVQDASDIHVRGVEILSYHEALRAVAGDVVREDADIVIVAGRMDRQALERLAREYPFVDVFITNNRTGGFDVGAAATTVLTIAGKPVFIGSEAPDHLGMLCVSGLGGEGSYELRDITLDDGYPPDPGVTGELNEIVDVINKQDYEEMVTVKTGTAIASVLKTIFAVNAVILEKQSLFYYPLEDSLTVVNIQQIIRPGTELVSCSMRGSLLKSVWEQSRTQVFPEIRLVYAGLTDDGKIDTIPIQEDWMYTVITTRFLQQGGNGYEQFAQGSCKPVTGVDMLDIMESYLVTKEERLCELAKIKIWDLTLNLDIGSNFNKTDVNRDISLYGDAVLKPMKSMTDQMAAYFDITSWNNVLNIRKKRNILFHRLNLKYRRSGFLPERGDIIYKETDDKAELYNKYTYDLPTFILKPYVDLTAGSEVYSGRGKHPIIASMSAGFTRKIHQLWDMDLNIGLDSNRNYFNNENSFGAKAKMTVNKSFSPNSFFTEHTTLYSDTNITYTPIAKYHMAFTFENINRLQVHIWRNFNFTFDIKSYLYQDNRYRKLAVGLTYDFTLNYGMSWKK